MSTPSQKKPRTKKAAGEPVVPPTPESLDEGGMIESATAERIAQLAKEDAARLDPNRVQEVIDAITDESGDVNAAKLRAAFEEAERRERDADEALLHGIEADEAALEAELARLRSSREEIEVKEANRAHESALALEFIVTGCEFATVHFPDPASGKTLPTFTMNHPCVLTGFQKKSQPDNDCRFCIHHTRHVLPLPMHQKRYPRSGMVIPIGSDAEADALAYFLKATGMTTPRSVDNEIHFVEQAIEHIRRTRDEVTRRAGERRRRA